jgi:hypothetical protein
MEGPKRLRDDHRGARHQQAAKDEKDATHQSTSRHSHAGAGLGIDM